MTAGSPASFNILKGRYQAFCFEFRVFYILLQSRIERFVNKLFELKVPSFIYLLLKLMDFQNFVFPVLISPKEFHISRPTEGNSCKSHGGKFYNCAFIVFSPPFALCSIF